MTEERAALQLFEQAFDLPADERESWLRRQSAPDAVITRALQLLARGTTLGRFLERPVAATLPDPPLRLPDVGERIGAYRLERLIEAGGMGVVYQARRDDDSYQQRVAIKLVQPMHLAGDAGLRKRLIGRFEAERSILAQLQHPNIARILDGGSTASGIPYLVMEYIDGISLIEYCERHDLDVEQRLRMFGKVCEAVQDAHRHLIVHRDLKPDNVLVDSSGEPHLLDFGIAKLLGSERDAHESTALLAMTPAYASPEQLRQQPITTRSDVYSLGVMLYQLVSGQRPYELAGLSPVQAERAVCETEPEPVTRAARRARGRDDPRRTRHAVAADLDRIIAKAMHKDPRRRYGSAQELADDLQRFRSGLPVKAHADTAVYRAGKFLRRHRLASTVATLALAAVLAAAGVAMWQARQARQAAADSAEISQFLIDILARSDPGTTGGEITLGQALDAAAEQIGARFSGRPAMAADIRHAVGYSMLSRYRLDQAQVQLETGLLEAASALGDSHPKTLQLLQAIALLRQYQDRIPEAIDTFREVLHRLEASGQARTSLYVVTHNDLGVLYLNRGDYDNADRHIGRALAGVEHEGVPVTRNEHANILSNLAHTRHGKGDLDQADELYARAAALLDTLFPDGSRDSAILVNNRALLAHERGRRDEAMALLRDSLAMRRRVFHGDHPHIVTALVNIGRQALINEQVDMALEAAREAVAVVDRIPGNVGDERILAWTILVQASARAGLATEAEAAMKQVRRLSAAQADPSPVVLRYIEDSRRALCALDPGHGEDC